MRAETKFIWGYAECRHHSAKPNGNQMRAETKFILAMPSAETIRQSQMGIK